MCGRTACTLNPECIRKLCSRQISATDSNEKIVFPVWLNDPGGHQYSTSYNLPPSIYSPVLISSKQRHISDLEIGYDQQEALRTCPLAIQPMMWGLIPSWHKGDLSSFNYKMNNARSDSLLSKASYQKPLQAGQRCAVLADGYYEWFTSKDKFKKKQPYFLYFSENSEVYKSLNKKVIKTEIPISENHRSGKLDPILEKIESNVIKCEHDKDESNVIKCEHDKDNSNVMKQEHHKDESNIMKQEHDNDDSEPTTSGELPIKNMENKKTADQVDDTTAVVPKKLLTMAGVFDVWKSKDTDEIVYSYAVITVDAHKDYEFIHDRMPAILKDEEEVDRWLNFEDVPLDEALKLIRPTNSLACHPVSTSVNNSRQNSPDCILPINLDKPDVKKAKPSKSGNLMMWLGGKRIVDDGGDRGAPPKKSKIA